MNNDNNDETKLKNESIKLYFKQHVKVVDFMLYAAQKLKLSVQPRTIACMLYHNVVWRQEKCEDQEKIELYLLASTCLYLAAKIAEEPQRIRDVVNVSHRLLHPEEEPLEIGETYWNLRDSITACELMVLRYMRFHVLLETPVKYLLLFLNSLRDWSCHVKEWEEAQVSQTCWKMVNDVCYLPLLVAHSPALLATAIIYTVFQSTATQVIENKDGERKWFQVFVPDCTESQLQELGYYIMTIYDDTKS